MNEQKGKVGGETKAMTTQLMAKRGEGKYKLRDGEEASDNLEVGIVREIGGVFSGAAGDGLESENEDDQKPELSRFIQTGLYVSDDMVVTVTFMTHRACSRFPPTHC